MTTSTRGMLLIVLVALAQRPAVAATLSGEVRSGGQPVRAALVTLASEDGLFSETVYTDDGGRYRLATDYTGAGTLRARAPLKADATQPVNVPAGAGAVAASFDLRELKDPQEISDSLPASTHFARIRFDKEIDRQQFQTDCLSCHQIGNAFTRPARPHELWEAIVKRMVTYDAYKTEVKVPSYVAALEHAFDGKPVVVDRLADVAAEALPAKITEWKLPGAIIAHDTEFNPRDGKFYTTDQAIDTFYVTDPKTNKTTLVPIPVGNVPEGGRFAELGLQTPFNLTVHHGVHSLQLGEDGLFYVTAAIGGAIGVFDPATGSYKSTPLGGRALYPHTLRIDRKGNIWFSVHLSNQMGRYVPKTGEVTIIELPTAMARDDERSTAPYGVDINPLDGSVWYSKLWANKIGRIDPDTLAVQEWIPPVVGPRRVRFDAAGKLWIPGYGDGRIASLDTRTMTYQTYTIPGLTPGEVEAPYSLAVDPATQDVWITANLSDRVFRFIQSTGKFIAYPLPTRGTYQRDIIFPGDGRVCGSSNPMPPAPPVVEGGMDAVVCIDPGAARHVAERAAPPKG